MLGYREIHVSLKVSKKYLADIQLEMPTMVSNGQKPNKIKKDDCATPIQM